LQALQNELSNFIAQIMDEHKTSTITQNWNIEDVPKVLSMFFLPHLKKMVSEI
jgi:hypothetical protein